MAGFFFAEKKSEGNSDEHVLLAVEESSCTQTARLAEQADLPRHSPRRHRKPDRRRQIPNRIFRAIDRSWSRPWVQRPSFISRRARIISSLAPKVRLLLTRHGSNRIGRSRMEKSHFFEASDPAPYRKGFGSRSISRSGRPRAVALFKTTHSMHPLKPLLLRPGGFCGHVDSRFRGPIAPDGKIHLSYWEKWSGKEEYAMQQAVNQFNRSQDRIVVDFLSVGDIGQQDHHGHSGRRSSRHRRRLPLQCLPLCRPECSDAARWLYPRRSDRPPINF